MSDTKSALKAISDYVVKPVGIDDLDRAIDVWSLAFGFSDRIRWRKFYESCIDERIGVYLDDYLVAIAGIAHFEVWMGDKLIPCGGISAVACEPAHRRRGLIRKCLKSCLESLHDKRVPLSTLWPFSYPFYERMGYALTDLRYQVTAQLSTLPDRGDSSGFKRIQLDDFEELKEIHAKWINGYNLSHSRSNHQWRRMLFNQQKEVSIFKSDDAYVIFNTKPQNARVLDVQEFAYLNDQAYLDGLSLIRRLDDLSFDKVLLTTCDPEKILSYGPTDPQMEFKYTPGIMARIVHLKSLLEHLEIEEEDFVLSDPLEVTEPLNGAGNGNLPVIGPGRMVQLLTGLFVEEGAGKELKFANKYKDKKPFCIEFF